MYYFNQNENKPQKLKIKEQVNLFVFVLISIFLILLFFGGKAYWKQKKNIDLAEKIQAEKEKETEIPVEYASPEEVFKSIKNNKVQLLDIRENQEFELKHIETSDNLPISKLKNKESELDLIKKDKLIIIIDSQEQLEGKILADHLKNQGLRVKYLKGGIINYIRENYPLVNYGNPTQTEDLLKVKSYAAQEVKDNLLKGNLFAFVDTRPPTDFKKDNISGSINIPLEEIEKRKSSLPTGKIMLYDEDPLRSFRAASKLFDMGILSVYNCTDNYTTLKETLFKETPPAPESPK